MKQSLTALIVPLVVILNGCCCCNCKPECPPPPQETEISVPAAQETQIEETPQIMTEQAAQELSVLPAAEKPKIEKAAAALTDAHEKADKKDAAVKPQTPPASFVNPDGRYLHPWAALPFIPNGQTLFPAPWSYEEMQFGVHYTFIRAGTAYIKTKGVVETDFGPAYMIETLANSAKVIDSVFKVRDINYSWISVKDFSSLGYSQSIREGNYIRDEWVKFDAANRLFIGSKKKKGAAELLKGTIDGPVQDMLTSLYYVRVRGADLSAGKSVTFDVNDGETTYPLIVKFIKKETVKVPAGKFNCIVVEPGFRKEGIFVPKGKSIRVWLTDDERRIPVKMETVVFIGTVSASLENYKQGGPNGN